MKSHWSVFAALAPVALLPVMAHGVSPEALADAARVEFEWGVKIPLRDGVHLNATVYRPRDATAPRPCIFTLTPYISQRYHDRGMYFAGHGYPFLAVDVRGRGNSEGTFRPLLQEAHDGYDVVEWLARQPYCNGKVTMWGGSYAGYDQWATAKELPPHLATIVPVASPYAGIDFPGRTNIFYSYDIRWLTLVSGRAFQSDIFADDAFWIAAYRRWYESGAPFRRLDAMVGNSLPVFQEWLSHPDGDAYWDSYNPTADDYAGIEIPILTITGIYDGDQPGALEHYRQYMKNASAAGRARHYLVIGPWDHAGTRTPKAQFGGLTFGPASLVDLGKLHLDWYRWTMQEGSKPEFLRQPVAYYVTGAEKWRYADSLEAVTAESTPYFLDSAGDSARDVFASGSLKTGLHGSGGADHYTYDPRDTSATALEVTADPDSLVDQRMLYGAGPTLVYHSAPFANDTEISGFFRFTAWIALDQADTDFFVTVSEVTADASVLPLSADAMRARYRDGLRTPQLNKDRAAHRYEFDHFTFTARLLRKGSRLRLVLAAGNSMYTEKNSNAGGVVAEESIGDARPVVVTLYHDRRRPSVLYVPIAAAEPTAAAPLAAPVNDAGLGAAR
jgi:hypothetical protein